DSLRRGPWQSREATRPRYAAAIASLAYECASDAEDVFRAVGRRHELIGHLVAQSNGEPRPGAVHRDQHVRIDRFELDDGLPQVVLIGGEQVETAKDGMHLVAARNLHGL